ncbi:MAG: UDP-N-acetylmuramoyl-L-alanine--D-glutamate ligase, partial [Desulfobulbus sp.]
MLPAGVKRAVVLGLGVSGMAVVHFLQSRGVETAVSEYRPYAALGEEEQKLVDTLACETGGHSEDFVLRGDIIVAS